jgi:hypothetical protein
VSRRIGRWTYYQHPYNGPVWRLDGTTLDLEHDPSNHSVCIGGDQCNGAWVLYKDGRYAEPVSERLDAAMEWVEMQHDKKRAASLVITSISCDELAGALRELARRTGNGNAYFPALATHIFEYVERQRTFAALRETGTRHG